jgi:8-oxo-dGTP pyrophosphatase MutT (NUDIX family)
MLVSRQLHWTNGASMTVRTLLGRTYPLSSFSTLPQSSASASAASTHCQSVSKSIATCTKQERRERLSQMDFDDVVHITKQTFGQNQGHGDFNSPSYLPPVFFRPQAKFESSARAGILLLLARQRGCDSNRRRGRTGVTSSTNLVFMRRTDHMRNHAGQISCPGGAFDDAVDGALCETAIRETMEEIGVDTTPPHSLRILGALDRSFISKGARFRVVPFVGCMEPGAFPVQPDEVANVLEIPLSHLLQAGVFENNYEFIDEANNDKWTGPVFHITETVPHPMLQHPSFDQHSLQHPQQQKTLIWGLTAYILRYFLNTLVNSPDMKRFADVRL